MLHQEVFVERLVVVEVVTTRVLTSFEAEASMGRALVSDALMAAKAVILRQAQPHRRGHLGSMFAVAGDAEASVQLLDARRVTRVGELGFRVAVVHALEFSAVTLHAGHL